MLYAEACGRSVKETIIKIGCEAGQIEDCSWKRNSRGSGTKPWGKGERCLEGEEVLKM